MGRVNEISCGCFPFKCYYIWFTVGKNESPEGKKSGQRVTNLILYPISDRFQCLETGTVLLKERCLWISEFRPICFGWRKQGLLSVIGDAIMNKIGWNARTLSWRNCCLLSINRRWKSKRNWVIACPWTRCPFHLLLLRLLLKKVLILKRSSHIFAPIPSSFEGILQKRRAVFGVWWWQT